MWAIHSQTTDQWTIGVDRTVWLGRKGRGWRSAGVVRESTQTSRTVRISNVRSFDTFSRYHSLTVPYHSLPIRFLGISSVKLSTLYISCTISNFHMLLEASSHCLYLIFHTAFSICGKRPVNVAILSTAALLESPKANAFRTSSHHISYHN